MSSLLNASRVKVSRMKSLSSVFFSSNPPKGNGSGNNKKGPDPVHHPFVNRNRRTRIQRSVGVDSSSRAEEVASNPNRIFRPVVVVPSKDDINVGAELVGKISKQEVLKVLNHFNLRTEVQNVAKAHGLDSYLFQQAYISFRKYCMDLEYLPSELYVTLSDLIKGHGHVDDLFPYFLSHARKVFPHLECIEELKGISNLTNPTLWYPEARNLNRRIIFHAGPTNSGKTYHALERFTTAKSGVYCGPLKLLAAEVYHKTNAKGVDCDLVTGEERKYAREDGEPSSHISCTVEMTNFSQHYEVAVIDEIQMVKDFQRGWAWTRALLGIPADEVHVCGEAAAIDLVREIMFSTGEETEVRKYKRLTDLIIEDKAIQNLKNIRPGDCIVCFSKQQIYSVSQSLEKLGVECAVIYGSLPPGPKLAMAEKFNNPDDPCKVLVATDAVGMGLNLNIRRVIFYSMNKLIINENGEREMVPISVSQALQIAGRAGRFNTQWSTGYVTTFHEDEVMVMKEILSKTPDEIYQAGLHPTFEQIEMYAYHLPHATLANLVDIFVSLSTLDDNLYTLCKLDDLKFLADMLEHIKLPLKAKYTFCCAPINRQMPLVCTMFMKIARQFSNGELVTFDWLCHQIGWPFSPPVTILDLIHLEAVHDVLDLYLWLSYRFKDMFPDTILITGVREELESVIEEGVVHIVQLLKNTETGRSSAIVKTNEKDGSKFDFNNKKKAAMKNNEWDSSKNFQNKRASKPGLQSSSREDSSDPDSTFNNLRDWTEDETATSQGTGDAADGKDEATAAGNNLKQFLDQSGSEARGKITSLLLEKGLLTNSVLNDLRAEWEESRKKSKSSSSTKFTDISDPPRK